jgi:hypothetical protein
VRWGVGVWGVGVWGLGSGRRPFPWSVTAEESLGIEAGVVEYGFGIHTPVPVSDTLEKTWELSRQVDEPLEILDTLLTKGQIASAPVPEPVVPPEPVRFEPLEDYDAEKETQRSLMHFDRAKPGIRAFLEPGCKELDRVAEVVHGIFSSLFLASATGHAIDQIGERWGIVRAEGQNDDEYKARIRLEIDICLSSGTTDEIRDLVCRWFGWDGSAIRLTRNFSHILMEHRDAFYEILLPVGWIVDPEQPNWFKFSDIADESTFDSPLGFNRGRFAIPLGPGAWRLPYDIDEFLDRITASGVEWLVGLYGGFRFSYYYLESTYDSDRGFDTGKLVGGIRRKQYGGGTS